MLKPLCNIKSLLENNEMTSKHCLRLFGGVLSVMALAFIPNSVYATDYSAQEVITSDYHVARFVSHAYVKYGCNTVLSGSGITAVGARGSLFGADNNPSGCGYYIGHGSDNTGQLTWRSQAENGGITYDINGNITSVSTPSDIQSYSLNNSDYISKNFRSSVNQIGVNGFNNPSFTSNYFTIAPMGSDNEKYSDYIYLTFWKVPTGVIGSHLTPSVIVDSSNISLTGSALDTFLQDIYASTSFTFGYPSQILPTDLKNYLALYKQRHNIEDWDDYAFIVSYIPQYSQSYTLNQIVYTVSSSLVQDTIDQSLGGFSQYAIGAGNTSSSDTFPKLNYFYLSRAYTENNAWSDITLMEDLNSIRFNCVSATCHDQSIITAKNSISQHNKDIAGWDWGGNNGSNWFDVFSFAVAWPYANFFNNLTDHDCIDIPIIASWLYNTQSHLCTYWPSGIRDTLTPVFMSLGSILLFGFIVSWLKGSSGQAFHDNDTVKKGDRF